MERIEKNGNVISFYKNDAKFEIEVKNELTIKRNDEVIATTTAYYKHPLETELIIRFTEDYLFNNKKINALKVNDEIKDLILKAYEENKKEIETFFNNLKVVEIKVLDFNYYYIEKHKDELKRLNELEHDYFLDKQNEFIRSIKKFLKEENRIEHEHDFDGSKSVYLIDLEKQREEKKEVKTTEKKESKRDYQELYEAAEKMTDEDFEDIYGEPREFYIDNNIINDFIEKE